MSNFAEGEPKGLLQRTLQMRTIMKRRFEKVPSNSHASASPAKLLKAFDSKNFVSLNAQSLKKIRTSRLVKHQEKPEKLPSPPSPKNPKIEGEASKQKKSSPTTNAAADPGLKSVMVVRKPSNNTNYSLRQVRKKIMASSNDADDENNNGHKKQENATDRRPSSSATSTNRSSLNDEADNKSARDVEQQSSSGSTSNGAPTNSSHRMTARQLCLLTAAQGGTSSSQPQLQYLSNIKPRAGKVQARLMVTTESRKVRYGWYASGDSDSFRVRADDPLHSSYKLTDPTESVCFNERKAWAGNYVMCVGQANLCKWL